MPKDLIEASRYPEFRQQITATVITFHSIARAIREAGEISSDELYALLKSKTTPREYNLIIDALKYGGLVSETPAHCLRWVRGRPR